MPIFHPSPRREVSPQISPAAGDFCGSTPRTVWRSHSLNCPGFFVCTVLAFACAVSRGDGLGRNDPPRPKLQIINGSSQTVDIYWLKTPAERVPNGSVAPGRDTTIETTLGHRFVLVGREDKKEADDNQRGADPECAIRSTRQGRRTGVLHPNDPRARLSDRGLCEGESLRSQGGCLSG